MTDKRHKLDKKTRQRHFPEYDGGKGSKPRISNRDSRKAFDDNWDRIFRKEKAPESGL